MTWQRAAASWRTDETTTIRSHRQRARTLHLAPRVSVNSLDFFVFVLGVAWVVVVVGILFDWWADWWRSSSDFRLPVLLIAAVSSTLGGVVAALTYQRLREREERRRWRPATHAGAASLSGGALAVVQAIADVLRGANVDVPAEVRSRDEVRAVRDAYFEHQDLLVLSEPLASAIATFSERAWDLVSSTPGLRDDADLMFVVIQDSNSLRNWPATIRNIERGGGQPTARQLANLSVFRDLTWQLIDACLEGARPYLDPATGEASFEDFLSRRRQAEGQVADQ